VQVLSAKSNRPYQSERWHRQNNYDGQLGFDLATGGKKVLLIDANTYGDVLTYLIAEIST
jgi:hypothetical protein